MTRRQFGSLENKKIQQIFSCGKSTCFFNYFQRSPEGPGEFKTFRKYSRLTPQVLCTYTDKNIENIFLCDSKLQYR